MRPGKVQEGEELNPTRLESGALVHLLQNVHGNWKPVCVHGKPVLASLDGPVLASLDGPQSGRQGTLSRPALPSES